MLPSAGLEQKEAGSAQTISWAGFWKIKLSGGILSRDIPIPKELLKLIDGKCPAFKLKLYRTQPLPNWIQEGGRDYFSAASSKCRREILEPVFLKKYIQFTLL